MGSETITWKTVNVTNIFKNMQRVWLTYTSQCFKKYFNIWKIQERHLNFLDDFETNTTKNW